MYSVYILYHSVGSHTCDPTAWYSDFSCSADTRSGARCSADGYCRCPNIPHADECTCLGKISLHCECIVSAHRRILGMASVVCVLVKICVSSISLYKLDTDKLTAPFESAHQFTLACTVSDSKTVPGCHYNVCLNHSFVLTD